jgi:hypothetical protein
VRSAAVARVIDEGLEQPWPEPVPPAVEPFLQGHLIAQPPLFYAADLRHPIWRTTRLIADETPEVDRGEDFVDLALEDRPPYGIITTQSCDLSEERPDPRQPWLAVAAVYSRMARRPRRPGRGSTSGGTRRARSPKAMDFSFCQPDGWTRPLWTSAFSTT